MPSDTLASDDEHLQAVQPPQMRREEPTRNTASPEVEPTEKAPSESSRRIWPRSDMYKISEPRSEADSGEYWWRSIMVGLLTVGFGLARPDLVQRGRQRRILVAQYHGVFAHSRLR